MTQQVKLSYRRTENILNQPVSSLIRYGEYGRMRSEEKDFTRRLGLQAAGFAAAIL